MVLGAGMQITRVDENTYRVARVQVCKAKNGWDIYPQPQPGTTDNSRLFTARTLDDAFNFCAGAMEMMAPAEGANPRGS